jgi:hypothetical protein
MRFLTDQGKNPEPQRTLGVSLAKEHIWQKRAIPPLELHQVSQGSKVQGLQILLKEIIWRELMIRRQEIL